LTTPLGDLTQIPITTHPTQGLPSLGDVSVTLYNQDITNLVWVSYQQWFSPGSGNSIPIQPLTSITISARKAIYVASTVTGVASLLVLPEGSQANPSPAQIAAQINALGLATLAQQITQQTVIPTNISTTGVPLLNLQSVLAFGVALPATAAAGSSVRFPAVGNLSVNQPSFEFVLGIYTNTPNATFAEVNIQWFDANSNIITQDIFWCYPGVNLANIHNIEIHGITKGNGVAITVSATSNQVTVGTLNFYPCSRVIALDTFRTQGAGTFANGALLEGGFELGSHILAQRTVAAQGAGATDNTTVPLCSGKVWVFGNSASGVADLNLQFVTSTDQSGAGNHVVAQLKSDGNGNLNAYITLPQVQCNIGMTNGNAAAKTTQYQLIVAEY
jgi:hypothetical protein